jgi:hypothetical protein
MAPRSPALAVALCRTRAALNAIQREWNVESEDGDVGMTLCNELQHVQQYLRNLSSPSQAVDPVVIIKPFVSLLRAATLSGPYKLLALDSLQIYLKNQVLTEEQRPVRVAPALQEIVAAVTRCKFVQTDAAVDEQVQVQLVATLRALFAPSLLRCMSDSVCSMAVEALHAMTMQAAQQVRTVRGRLWACVICEACDMRRAICAESY